MAVAAAEPAGGPVCVAVPGGIWRAGESSPVREVELRAVDGEDEAFLFETADVRLPSRRATALLGRCLVGRGDPDDVARSLTVGDREALLLHLRRLTLGDTLDCVLTCPAVDCAERMELELEVGDLLVAPYGQARREYEEEFVYDGTPYRVTFRLPTASDLDHAASLARIDLEQGALELLRRCVLEARSGARDVQVDRLPSSVQEEIAAAMAERDPQAELELDLSCPTCGTAFSAVLDTASFFLQELDERAAQLLREVHVLAWHYHWTENEILRMPASRRERYLELVAESVVQARSS